MVPPVRRFKQIGPRVPRRCWRRSSTCGLRPCARCPACAAGRQPREHADRGDGTPDGSGLRHHDRTSRSRPTSLIGCRRHPLFAARSSSAPPPCCSASSSLPSASCSCSSQDLGSRPGTSSPQGVSEHTSLSLRDSERRHCGHRAGGSPGHSVRAIGPGTVAERRSDRPHGRRPACTSMRSPACPRRLSVHGSSFMAAGIMIIGVGSAFYIGAGHGSRPSRFADARRLPRIGSSESESPGP